MGRQPADGAAAFGTFWIVHETILESNNPEEVEVARPDHGVRLQVLGIALQFRPSGILLRRSMAG